MNTTTEKTYLKKAGEYRTEEELMEDAFNALMEKKPELSIKIAVAKYKEGKVSLNKAAEIANMSSEEFKDLLKKKGIQRESSVLSDEDRKKILNKL